MKNQHTIEILSMPLRDLVRWIVPKILLTPLLAMPMLSGQSSLSGLQPGEVPQLVFFEDFQTGDNRFTEVDGPAGDNVVRERVEFPSGSGNFGTRIALDDPDTNQGGIALWRVFRTDAPTLFDSFETAMRAPEGDVTDFVFQFKLNRLAASDNVVESGMSFNIDFAPSRSPGGLRFPFGQPNFFQIADGGYADTFGTDDLLIVDHNNLSDLRFSIAGQGDPTISLDDAGGIYFRFAVRTEGGATEEAYFVDDFAVYQVIPEPSLAVVVVSAAAMFIILLRRRFHR